MKFKTFYCPICNDELHYRLIIPPKYTKLLKCNNCRTKLVVPIKLFMELMNDN
jgi:hypothetical protein